MKKFIMLLLLSIGFSFTSCTNDLNEVANPNTELAENEEMVELNFSPYSLENMTSNSPSTRAMTRGGTYTSIADLANYLDVWFIEGENVTVVHQEKTQTGFGTVSLVLNKTKTYTLYAVAHKGTGAASLENGIITFADNKVTETFFYKTSFSPANTTNLSCQMKRIIGQFRIEFTDALPDACTQMKFTVYQTGTTFNPANETSGSPIDKITHYTSINKNTDGTANFTVTIMPDNTTDQTAFTILAEAMNTNNEVIETKTFENVPIKAGYRTIYRGAFFTSASTSSGFLINDWDSFDTINF